jgi:hypothetical protein
MSITITLRQILDAGPCYDPRDKELLPPDHDLDAPISFRAIVEKVGIADALWCCQTAPEHGSLWRHFSVDCAERVQHLMTDERIRNALVVARRFAQGQATQAELADARDAALAAMAAALDALDAMGAALAARAALAALAALDARAALYAARDAALAAMAAERDWQTQRFLQLVDAGEWTP